MAGFIRIFEVVLPVMLVVVFGYFSKKIGLFGDEFIETGSKLVFKVFLPINIFISIYKGSSIDAADPKIILYIFIAQVILILTLYFVYKKMNFDNEEMAVMIQTMVRSNIALIGIALAENYFSDDSISIVAIYIGIIAAINNGLAIIVYEVLTRKEENFNYKKIILSIFKNPVFIAAITGILVNIIDISIYEPFINAGESLGSVATPLGLLCVGSSIRFGQKDADTRGTRTVVITKGLIVPLIYLTIFTLLGVTGPEMFVMIITFAAPVAISSHAMSMIYTNRAKLCAEIIVYTTIFNSITIFFAIYILSTLGVI